MPTDRDLSRISLRRDQILELHFDKLPYPSEAMLKLPGVRDWWQAMQLHDERRIQAFHRMLNNMSQAADPTLTGGGDVEAVAATPQAVTNVTNITQVTQNNSLPVLFGTDADPNGVITGQQYQFYKNTSTGELWIKQTSGTGNTGWI